MLYVDIPTQPELQTLVAARSEASVSFYLRTTPETQDIGAARIALGNLLRTAVGELEAAGTDKRTIWPIEEQVHDLLDDDGFWTHQANSLALFVTPGGLRSFRLPNRLEDMVQVSDRFHLKPLLRALTAQQHAFVLALAENEVRLVEVFADLPASEVAVAGMPRDAASAAGTANVNSRSYSGRKGGGEGQKVLLRGYCRKVDAALRPVLAGRSEPLILAAAEPLRSMFRSLATHQNLAAETLDASPVRKSASELAAEARPVLDAIHQREIEAVHALFSARENEGRATTQIARAARAATFGAVDTLLVDIDEVVPGTIDETTGEVSFADEESADSYGVVDEIAGRVLAAGGRVLAVRRDDIPQKQSLAAILRYAI
ncbi:baeRF11 domain-containing protein [Salinarimonas chemoclinalis]|uniref:baeRF11 domain-containing protein n=1 Tax=Salinarimonas chemoclinalis TaxID=3241599 RepID=UPI0035581983